MQVDKQQYNQTRDEMYLSLDKVSEKLKEVGQSCILLCGETKAGKSTVQNLIVNPQVLVGMGNNMKPFYVLRDANGPNTANISDSFTSVTMMPNVSKVPDTQLTIIDLPGTGERGKGIEVIKVNFINVAFFQAVKKAKFLLVFTEGTLKDISNGGFKDTLHNFLSFFNFEKFSPQEKEELFSSIAFCFTSVDFRGNTRENVQKIYLQAIQTAIKKLEIWHHTKPSQMPMFSYAKQLVLRILQNKRIQLFQLAVNGQSPGDNNIIQRLEKHEWRFLSLRDKIDKVQSHFDRQYQSLEPAQKTFVDENIDWRFSFCLKIRMIIGQMLTKMIDNMGEKLIKVDQEVMALNKVLKQQPNYDTSGQNQQIVQICTVDQRFLCFKQLLETVQKVELFDSWKAANKKSPTSEYYTRHLTEIFKEQFTIIKKLFSSTPGVRDMLKRLQINIKKMLAQASIFSHLSTNYSSKFKQKLVTEIIYGNEIGGIVQVKQKFIKYFQDETLQIKDWTVDETTRIIKIFTMLMSQSKEVNPILFYRILYNLKYMLAKKYLLNNMVVEFARYRDSALFETLKSHICFLFVPLSNTETKLKQLIHIQQKIFEQSRKIFSQEKHIDHFDRNMLIQLLFQGLDISKPLPQLRSLIRNIFKNLSNNQTNDYSKNIKQLSNKNLLTQDIQKDIDLIMRQYRIFMKNQIEEEKLNINIPSTHSFFSQVSYYEKIKEAIAGKKVTFVIGESLCGKSVIIEALKLKKLCLNKDGRIDLEIQSSFNRINHSNIPSHFPHLSILNQGQNEFILQVPSYQHLPSPKKYINLVFLLDLMKRTKQFRILIVAKEATLKEKSFEKILIQIVNILFETSKKLRQSKNSVITLVINHLRSDKANCRNTLLGIVSSLKNVNEKASKCLSQIVDKSQYICESIHNIARGNQFSKEPYLYSKELSITYANLYSEFISSHEKDSFIKDSKQETNLLKQIINPLQILSSMSLCAFLDGAKLSQSNRSYKQIITVLNNPIASQYQIDFSFLPDFQAEVVLMDNRPQIYHKLIKLREQAQKLRPESEINIAYQEYGIFMEHFFKVMVYLCCKTRQQYQNFVKISTVVLNLVKKLEYYSLIFTQDNHPQVENLKTQLSPRQIISATINILDKSQELMVMSLKQSISWKEHHVRSNIQLLIHYIKTINIPTHVTTAARIDLLIFMLRLKKKNFEFQWDNQLTQQKLTKSIVEYPYVKQNSSIFLQEFLKKASKEENENTLNELCDIKRKLLALQIA